MSEMSKHERQVLTDLLLEEYAKELAALSDAELILHTASLQKHQTLPDRQQADLGVGILQNIWTGGS